MSWLEEILQLHDDRGRAERYYPPDGPHCGWTVMRVCGCVEWATPVMPDNSDKDAHREHVADAIRARLVSTDAIERAAEALLRSVVGDVGDGSYPVSDVALWRPEARSALTAAVADEEPPDADD